MRVVSFSAALVILLAGCGGSATETFTVEPPIIETFSPDPSSTENPGLDNCVNDNAVQITGRVSYQKPTFSAVAGQGLNYNSIQTLSIRGAQIQALGTGDCVLSTSTVSSTGSYSLGAPANSNVKIRVNARLINTAGATWDFEVRDNTNSEQLYALDGSFASSGAANSIRNLTATTGWMGSGYSSTRSSAPFAILDTIYSAIQSVVAVDAGVNMPAADIFWSVNNNTADGEVSLGEIGGAFYSANAIYLLGTANSDTDEFDSHVVAHEWAHYLDDNLSRSDTIGGAHYTADKLDMRVAASEGFATAFAALALEDPVYRDSSGFQQGWDFSINAETNASTAIGWFNEDSVLSILYDIADSASDASDSVSLGFAALYEAMTSTRYKEQASLVSVFSIIDAIKINYPSQATNIDTILNAQSISTIVDVYGTNETNNGGDANNLPIYKALADDGVPVQVCSSNTLGEYNKLGVRQFLRLSVSSSGRHTLLASHISGDASADPDINIYLNGVLVLSGDDSTSASESVTGSLSADEYIVEVYNYDIIDNDQATGASACFNVSVS